MGNRRANKPCPCGSGHKYKRCCKPKDWVEWRDGPRPEPPKPMSRADRARLAAFRASAGLWVMGSR